MKTLIVDAKDLPQAWRDCLGLDELARVEIADWHGFGQRNPVEIVGDQEYPVGFSKPIVGEDGKIIWLHRGATPFGDDVGALDGLCDAVTEEAQRQVRESDE